jgi:hypothetical protein
MPAQPGGLQKIEPLQPALILATLARRPPVRFYDCASRPTSGPDALVWDYDPPTRNPITTNRGSWLRWVRKEAALILVL